MKQNFADLRTPEGENLPLQPWQEYPRPQLQRDSFFNLNGEWEFSAGKADYDQTILVPFPPESALSGLKRPFDGAKLYYRTKFSLPEGFIKDKVILHFGAVDQIAEVYLNGKAIGSHVGGYNHFSFDVTDALAEENVLEVHVTDVLDKTLPYGKQCIKRGGMWYTPVSGIWQTVWMESVPENYIENLSVRIGPNWAEIGTGNAGHSGEILLEGKAWPLQKGKCRIEIENPVRWSPENPHLYHFEILCGKDRVKSYFALRTLEIRGNQLLLNGKKLFMHGLLDQGYFPEGIFTPASEEGFVRDIQTAKALGFNTLRKHIKVELDRFYYECDRLGMIVIQDMVNNGGYNFIRDTALPTIGMKRLPDKLLHRNRRTRENFLKGMEEMVRQLQNHPCICAWVIFNEGWGQFDSTAAYRKLKKLDDSRFVLSTSGWFRGGESDAVTHHCYFKPFRFKPDKMPVLLTEFGGYSCRIAGHSFNPDKTYGYKFFKTIPDFQQAIEKLYREEIIPAKKKGLCAAILTQLSDVEDETNGMMTYDRRIIKAGQAAMGKIAEELLS